MNAIAKIQLIETKPIVRPTYVQEFSSLDAFVATNLEALRTWYAQLTAWTDHGFSWQEFVLIQYDIERETAAERAAKRFEAQCDRDERAYASSYDVETGIRRYGEI